MKRPLILLVILSFAISSHAQKQKEKFFLFKADWSGAKDMKEAAYFMLEEKLSDTEYVCRYYHLTGPMIKWESFRDQQLDTPHGRFIWYNLKGRIDSTGTVWYGRKDGRWNYNYNDSLRPQVINYYNRGKFLRTVDLLNKRITFPDHTEDWLPSRNDEGASDLWVEAKFKGGRQAWKTYLESNLIIPERLKNLVQPGRGGLAATVIVSFEVSPAGIASDVYLDQSVEWSADSEAMRMIRESPQWTPATYNGTPVVYRQKQSITMQVVR